MNVQSIDEIGDLAGEFNHMLVSLEGHIQREIDHAKELTHARNLAVMGITAGKVTHEIGNLLNNIGMTLLILKTETLSARGQNALEILNRESDRIQQFTRNFLQFAKKPELHLERRFIDSIMGDVRGVYQIPASARGIRIELDHAGITEPLTVDHRLLYQVLNNLVKNSLEAIGEEGGCITIRASVENNTLILSVADTGAGMSEETRERLFEPFFTTKGKAGNGLGMAITHSIIHAHGGRIDCRSEPGKGTEFIIRIPLR
jgi:signal transduction histidine kinase